MSGKKKSQIKHADDHVDLVPLIDCVFLLLLFFMLCGRISTDQRPEQITVPPTKTAAKFKDPGGWQRLVVNIFGSTKQGKPSRNSIGVVGQAPWQSTGWDDLTGYQRLRQFLDKAYDRADKYDDPKNTGIKLPKVIIELRADADTEYRVIQEVQMVLSDSCDPNDSMKPKKGDPKTNKPFVNIDFTSRRTDDR